MVDCKKEITYKKLNIEDCKPDLLMGFERYQEIFRLWQKKDNEWILSDNNFIFDWDDNRKAEVATGLRLCAINGGIVIGAFLNNTLVGFASVVNYLFGKNKDYVQLEQMQVTRKLRGKGIGKELFALACKAAQSLGANKLYVLGHPSEASQAFYNSVGCKDTIEINQRLYEKEPYDRHLEFILDNRAT